MAIQTNGFIDNMKKESKKAIPLICFSIILFFLLIVAYFLQFASDFFDKISTQTCYFMILYSKYALKLRWILKGGTKNEGYVDGPRRLTFYFWQAQGAN
jgi:hypothetical protein